MTVLHQERRGELYTDAEEMHRITWWLYLDAYAYENIRQTPDTLDKMHRKLDELDKHITALRKRLQEAAV